MSQTETHFGKLRKVELGDETIEQWCKARCNEIEITEIATYHDSWEEEMRYSTKYNEKYFFVDGEVWEAVEHIESQDDDIDIMIPNEDGTVTFVLQFYNGGTCLDECIEDGLRRIAKK
jgi:hypothetical protein